MFTGDRTEIRFKMVGLQEIRLCYFVAGRSNTINIDLSKHGFIFGLDN